MFTPTFDHQMPKSKYADFRKALREMPIDSSFDAPIIDFYEPAHLYAGREGIKIKTKKLDSDTFRIWRIK